MLFTHVIPIKALLFTHLNKYIVVLQMSLMHADFYIIC
jgi:hypothetical protein